MTTPLPVNTDTTYADNAGDASVKLHQQHHDTLHTAYNGGDYFRSGYYSHGLFTSAALSTSPMAASEVRLRPFLVPVQRAFDRVGLNVTTAASAGGVLRFGIYTHASGLPAALIVDGGTADSTTTGPKEVTVAVTLTPGIYWIAVAAQVAGCSVSVYASSTVAPWAANRDTAAPTTLAAALGWGLDASVSGALPSSLTAASFSAGTFLAPAAALRAA